jgi:hypothetical protein
MEVHPQGPLAFTFNADTFNADNRPFFGKERFNTMPAVVASASILSMVLHPISGGRLWLGERPTGRSGSSVSDAVKSEQE